MEERQGGAEVEITPEMIEVGANIILSFDREFDDPREAARKVFTEMIESYQARELLGQR